ncbi:site-specific recombinase XerD [Rhodoglobus vestalii]|uniref:Site-specific recombinase XerD n=2 Tax=Rhodoglobus vestalii TaxID=193384 RepID=A0A8H2K7Y0_9MICO|nr:site-specific recombinase XerD [Rhodoglobus vestalii]
MGTVEPYETSGGRRYRVRYRKPDRSQTDKRGFKTKRSAEEYLATIEVSKLRGEWMDPTKSKVTVGEWARPWYLAHSELKPTTLFGYDQALRKHVLPRWAKTRLNDVSHSDVQSWVTSLSATHGGSSVKQTYLVLAGIFKFAARDGLVVRNPCEGIRLPRILKKERGYLSHEQVAKLAKSAGDQGDVVLLLAYTGIRWGELAALKVERVDPVKRRINIVEAITEPNGTIVWGTPKSHARRSVPFPEFLDTVIARHMSGKHRSDLMFTAPKGGVLRNSQFRKRRFDRAVAELTAADPQFPRVTPHDLRHTAASLAVSAGAHVKSLQRMLGHASAAMTLDVYADLFDDDLDAVAAALNDRAVSSSVGEMWAKVSIENSEPRKKEKP